MTNISKNISVKNLSELLQLQGIEKDTALFKILYVKNQVKFLVDKGLKEKEPDLLSVHFTENNSIYLEVLNVESPEINSLEQINGDLKEKLNLIAEELSTKLVSTLFTYNSDKDIRLDDFDRHIDPMTLDEKPFHFDLNRLDNFDFHDFKDSIEGRVYQELKKHRNDIPRKMVYLYSDLDFYENICNLYDNKDNANIESFLLEFIDYFLKNEDIFREKYEYIESIGDSESLNHQLYGLLRK